jgi:hypothetical protein
MIIGTRLSPDPSRQINHLAASSLVITPNTTAHQSPLAWKFRLGER